MAKKQPKSMFVCQSCGHQSPKWLGRCPECAQWDTLVEETVAAGPGGRDKSPGGKAQPVPLDAVALDAEYRFTTNIHELDRVLGGGLVPGSLVLIGGDPGIGKSTLMLQALYGLASDGRKVLYVTGEESIKQLRLRSKRLDTVSSRIHVVSEIDVQTIVAMIEKQQPAVMVIDSIQTMFSSDLTSAPGSVSQVRESAVQIMIAAKRTGVPVFLVGHVTKDGAIAGPRLLEHMVDTVLYFEGDRNHIFRILRSVKNRFGSTNEIGVFEMNEKGLEEVANPSAVFLSERPDQTPGSVVVPSIEGTRPILVELQALAASTTFGNPRRTILGIDGNRVALLVAVMEKKLGLHLMGHDIFMNVAGGVKVDEPAIDLGIVCAVASRLLDRPVAKGTVVIGEVGLTGEVRAVGQVEQRMVEAKKLGFSRCIVPAGNLKRMPNMDGMAAAGVRSLADALETLF